MAKQTPLYDEHVKLGALMVDFAGWQMPLHYGSQMEEHYSVRQDAGMFDVSHMGVIDIMGLDVVPFLKYALANNIGKLKTNGRALYTCLLNDDGGVIDDLIAYAISPTHYRLVVNAATTAKDLAWLSKIAKNYTVTLEHDASLAILAVQGPSARQKVVSALSYLHAQGAFKTTFSPKDVLALKPFHFLFDNSILIARTGYTGEDGVEIILPNDSVILLWQTLLQENVKPIGLGARDTLRLEAGLNLYGQDMNEDTDPLESNLSWTVDLNEETRDFMGKAALLEKKQQGVRFQLTGIRLLEKGVLRHDQTIWVDNEKVGVVTSGTFSPTLKQSIALARIDKKFNNGCAVEIRGKQLKAEITAPPFVKRQSA